MTNSIEEYEAMAARFNPDNNHHRRSIRLKGYDYAGEGAYFVTICAQNRAMLFGDVVDGQMRLNAAGRVAEECWQAIPDHFPHAALDAFVIMPNHIHGIVLIVDDVAADVPDVATNAASASIGTENVNHVGAKNFSPLRTPSSTPLRKTQSTPQPESNTTPFRSPSKTIGSIVRGFKIGVTKWMHANTDVHDVWQRNYYERIIRNEAALNRIRRYILENPARWSEDTENPGGIP